MFYAILTGDIVSSTRVDSKIWTPILESSLRFYSKKFDIFRGDSFQVQIPLEKCVEALFYIKANLRTINALDVRIGLGVGRIENLGDHVKMSSGEAFVHSGKAFDELEKDYVQVSSPWPDWNEPTNIMLQLATELANRWTINMAQTVKTSIQYPDANQHELARILKRKYQSQVSTELTKANWDKITEMINYCTRQLLSRC